MARSRTAALVSLSLSVLLLTACAQGGGTQAGADAHGVVVANAPAAAATPVAGSEVQAASASAVSPAANDQVPTIAATPASAAIVPSTKDAKAATNSSASAQANDDPTAEAYEALYGSGSAETATAEGGPVIAYDPWERYNRRVHDLNNGLDRRVFKPVATVYAHTVPRPIRSGVGNFFRNLGGPTNTLNALLQGKPSQSGASLFRFLVNSTFGIAGVFDVATKMGIPDKTEDFGQTFAKWGWKKSRYLELPLFGPRTVRDALGMLADMRTNPLKRAQTGAGQVALQTAQIINVRAMLLSTDAMREGAVDDYTLFRDAWWQRRNYMIWGEDVEDRPDELPDYLKDAPAKKPD